MRKTKEQAQQTRQQLLDAALEIFYRDGVTNTSMQAIADEAGMTRGALYWHFKNKEDLFDALFQQNFAPFIQTLNSIPEMAGDPWQNLRESFHALFEMLVNNEQQKKFCHVMHLKCEHTRKNATITELAHEYHKRNHELIHSVLEHCRQQGSLPKHIDLDLVSIYLKSSITGLLNIWLNAPEVLDLQHNGALLLDASLENIQHNPLFIKK